MIGHSASRRRRALRDVVLYGLCGGVLIAALKLAEYRFLVVERSVEIYAGLMSALFAGPGIWLGLTLRRRKPTVIVREIPAAGPFELDEARLRRPTRAASSTSSGRSAAPRPCRSPRLCVSLPDAEASPGGMILQRGPQNHPKGRRQQARRALVWRYVNRGSRKEAESP